MLFPLCAAVGPLLTAWVPFLQPMDLHDYWIWLLPPLVFGVALVYKALKLPDVSDVLSETVNLTIYILTLMVIAGVVLWLVVEAVEHL